MPSGWLRHQVRLQADGMTGHLHDFWPDVDPDSGWLEGRGESWERGPYFVDGLLPLAVLLDDARLKALAFQFVDWTLSHQQANQVQCSLNTKPWTTNSSESNLFGLEPHFGCCTGNYHQGWPKLVASLWMRTLENGLAALYGPCEVYTEVRNTPVRLLEETDYPFREAIAISVEPKRPVHFPLQLRIPEWAQGTTILVNGQAYAQPVRAGTFAVVEREWKPGDRLEIRLPMRPRVSR